MIFESKIFHIKKWYHTEFTSTKVYRWFCDEPPQHSIITYWDEENAGSEGNSLLIFLPLPIVSNMCLSCMCLLYLYWIDDWLQTNSKKPCCYIASLTWHTIKWNAVCCRSTNEFAKEYSDSIVSEIKRPQRSIRILKNSCEWPGVTPRQLSRLSLFNTLFKPQEFARYVASSSHTSDLV